MPPDPSAPSHEAPLSAAEQEAFVTALNRAHAMLLRYALSLVGHRHDAEDVLQRASVAMWRRFRTFESGTDFVAWATTFVFYEARNFQRVAGRSRLVFDEELLQTLAAERMAQLREWPARMVALEACVQKLAPSQRELVEDLYLRGIHPNELAERQNRAVQTIYNRVNLIRRVLAECVRRRQAEAHA